MSLFLELSIELAAVLCSILLAYWLILIYRKQDRIGWLYRDWAASTFAILVLTLAVVGLAFFIAGAIRSGLAPVSACLLGAAALVGMAWLAWVGLRMSHRLDAADAGHAPFERTGAAPASKTGDARS